MRGSAGSGTPRAPCAGEGAAGSAGSRGRVNGVGRSVRGPAARSSAQRLFSARTSDSTAGSGCAERSRRPVPACSCPQSCCRAGGCWQRCSGKGAVFLVVPHRPSPSLGDRMCPKPVAKLRHRCRLQGDVVGASGAQGSWGHPKGTAAALLGCPTGTAGLGAERRVAAPSAPSPARGGVGAAGQPGLCSGALSPKSCREGDCRIDGRNCKASGEGEAELVSTERCALTTARP